MWRPGGVHTSRPIFALSLNHKVRNQLHKLGNMYLNTEDIDPNTIVD